MRVNGQPYRSLWYDAASAAVVIIDQTCLPHAFRLRQLRTLADAAEAIRSMQVRGAPLIGITAAFGIHLALRAAPGSLHSAINTLLATRPTAVNLAWALDTVAAAVADLPMAAQADAALEIAQAMAEADVAINQAIGAAGLPMLERCWRAKADHGAPLNVLTHCNAGWLATVDWGTALAVVYAAQAAGIPLHVWVDETRPRNQGASLTTWELAQQGIAHTLVTDNAGGWLMAEGQVDLVLVGSDRTTLRGDVCNKIGTYLKALAAADNGIPFYVALPVSSFDTDPAAPQPPIEQRAAAEVTHIQGRTADGRLETVQLAPDGTRVANPGFDVTPARLVTALITERGVCAAEPAAILRLLEGRG